MTIHINKVILFGIVAIISLNSCNTFSLEPASISYQAHRDYASLVTIYQHLTKGMKRIEVERLLGESDYSPIDGQYYYSSDHESYLEKGQTESHQVPVGVVLDYRDDNGIVTEELQTFWMGTIGE